MVFPYKTVLLVGATSGIGAGLADKFIQEGAKVIAVGRRQERLDAFVQKHGADKAAAIKFDITDRSGLDAFMQRYVAFLPAKPPQPPNPLSVTEYTNTAQNLESLRRTRP